MVSVQETPVGLDMANTLKVVESRPLAAPELVVANAVNVRAALQWE